MEQSNKVVSNKENVVVTKNCYDHDSMEQARSESDIIQEIDTAQIYKGNVTPSVREYFIEE